MHIDLQKIHLLLWKYRVKLIYLPSKTGKCPSGYTPPWGPVEVFTLWKFV